MKVFNNMKNIVLWLFVIMILSFSFSIMMFRSSGVNLMDFSDVDNINNIGERVKRTIDEESSFNIKDIDNINIRTISSDIRFIPQDGDEIRVHLYGDIDISKRIDSPRLIAKMQNRTLKIGIEHKKLLPSGFHSAKINLDIYMPNGYSESIEVKTTSADMDLGSLDIKNISIESVSGDVDADSLYTEHTNFDSVSGKIVLTDFKGSIDSETTSGDININFKDFKYDVDIHSTSGDIDLTLPHDAEFYLESKSISGNIKCDFPISLEGKLSDKNIEGRVGQGNNTMVLSTISGDINITEK